MQHQFIEIRLPDCPDPGVLESRMIPLAANNCFVTGVPLCRGSIGTIKLITSGNADISHVEGMGDDWLAGGESRTDDES